MLGSNDITETAKRPGLHGCNTPKRRFGIAIEPLARLAVAVASSRPCQKQHDWP